MPTLEERISGGLIGLLVGDALGVPYEFHDAHDIPALERIEFDPPPGFERAHAQSVARLGGMGAVASRSSGAFIMNSVSHTVFLGHTSTVQHVKFSSPLLETHVATSR
jgi:hypothetical protein